MSASMPEINFSELSNKPLEAVRKLHESPTRSLRVHRRGDEEDLVLVTASRAAEVRQVWSVTTSLFMLVLRHDPQMRAQLPELLPREFPWVRFLPEDEVDRFATELLDILEASESLGTPAPVVQLLIEWQHTAEVWSDPKLKAILDQDGQDFGEVPRPGGPEE